jgi:hypothetical protein
MVRIGEDWKSLLKEDGECVGCTEKMIVMVQERKSWLSGMLI